MANTIWGNHDDYLGMSNGATDVLLTTLCLSGSRIAVTEHEKDFIVFLAERDQSVVGIGTVGFHIGEMPWNRDSLTQDKAFMIKVTDSAISGLGREMLSYDPPEKFLIPNLRHFRRLIEAMEIDWIQEKDIAEWYEAKEENEPGNKNYPYCKKHHILLTCFGCIACNDE